MTKQNGGRERGSPVIEAEDQMLDAYRRQAATVLGLSPADEEVERAAEDAYWNDAPGQARAWTPEELARYDAELEPERRRYLEWRAGNPE